jgi:uncharacterized iron-regulated membrane protein
MTLGQRLARQPQGVWLRKALFQVHLWTGICVGLYIFTISISGSAIVFRREIARLAWSSPTVVPTARILTAQELGAVVKKAYPRFEVVKVTFSKKQDRAAEVLIARGQRQVERAFNPYTGKDLGAIGNDEPKIMYWLVRFHDDLLAGHTGRLYNGVGAILVTVLCATGILIWWPGVTRWWRSLILRRKVGWARFNWDLHSAVGFWMFAFVLMWGVSGIYLAFPEPFTNLVDYLQPLDANSRDTRTGDEVLAWLARIHFGRAYGTSVKWLWTLLGFVPVILFVTGAIMWWHRVLKPALRKSQRFKSEVGSVQTSDLKLEV